MLKQIMTITGAALTAAMLAVAVPAQAGGSGALPKLKECLAKAAQASDPVAARNHCIWRHWERLASGN